LEANALLWLCGDLEKKLGQKKGSEKKKDEEEVQIRVRAKVRQENKKTEKKKKGNAEKEEEGKAKRRGWLCIPKTMRGQILLETNNTPAGAHFSMDRMYLRRKDRYFSNQMWRDTQCYVEGCNLCHPANHRSRKPMGLLQPLSVTERC